MELVQRVLWKQTIREEHEQWAKQAGGDSFEQTAKKAKAVVALHIGDAGREASDVFTHFQRDLEKRHGG